jgi:adenosylcobinamide kinase/adenosylcobinamide-phosphate guanylyltransferase
MGEGALLTFVTGGSRSGKSGFAEMRAEELADLCSRTPIYFATAEALDTEMVERIALHREGRGERWQTVEVPVDPASELLKTEPGSVVVLDCITLWVSNLMGSGLADADIMERATAFFSTCAVAVEAGSSVFLVSNEVGSGIVPDNPVSRRFRDLAGKINAAAAHAADEAYLIVAGLPLKLK